MHCTFFGILRFRYGKLTGIAMTALLQVQPGSVTPLAVVQPTASAVVLLLDKKLKGKERLLVHPMINTSTIAISSAGLEAFLRYDNRCVRICMLRTMYHAQ